MILTSAYADPADARAARRGCVSAQAAGTRDLAARTPPSDLIGETRRVLIVDDNEVSRYIVRQILDQPWLRLSEASNGAEALRLIQESPPDALILDLLMPDVSGFEVLQRIRQSSETRNLPVLIYTSKTLSEAERTQLESLQTSVLRKEDVSARLSAQPFLQWLNSAGLTPETKASPSHA